jgi:ABC-2 type transport system ATP-binding protein
MKMKAVLLASLAYRPRLLVLDEPFSGLDPLVREEFVGGLLEITEREGWTIFLSSHDMAEVERLADTVGVIHDGQLRLSETTDTLENRFRRVSVDGTAGTVTPAALGPLPAHYLSIETDGPRLRFVDSQWPGDEAGLAALNTRFPQSRITFTALSLRDILVTLLTHYKNNRPAA